MNLISIDGKVDLKRMEKMLGEWRASRLHRIVRERETRIAGIPVYAADTYSEWEPCYNAWLLTREHRLFGVHFLTTRWFEAKGE